MKTKLEMAHDYLRDIVSNWEYGDSFDPVAEAWKYADAMQAEAEKREKEEAAQRRKEIREMLNAPNTFAEREGQHFDDVEEWQPDWSQAPDWANWWSVDENGTANFSGKKPNIKGKQWVYYSAASESPCHIQAPSFGYTGDWRNSLRKRPE